MASTVSSLIYYRLFTPEEIKEPLAEFSTERVHRSTTQLRIGPDNDGKKEKIFKIRLLTSAQAQHLIPADENVTIVIRFGSAIIHDKQDSLYIMISDDYYDAIGFKISESEPIKGVDGRPGKFLDFNENDLRGDDNVDILDNTDWPDEFVITLKPHASWGTIYFAQGNGKKVCVGFNGRPRFRDNGVFLDLYRHDSVGEYIINYIEVKIFINHS